MIAGFGGLGHSDLALPEIVTPIATGGGDPDRRVIFHAEQFDAGVELGYIIEPEDAAEISGNPRDWRAASPRRRCPTPCSRNAPAARSGARPARSRRR